ncbi:hypothetical protein FH966_08810 [Lentibacillus cibarius]|uniref:DnaD domain protein n=1 Tax=Lentibacillus cibarius TaxID=2583219 RepID=A0A549YIS2_9BACI|nr:hypothetical protein [Lentibacillus cibarius]TRM11770.1 hypothetical protein FH966_08810 [Lentibacillus cibarius]
MNYIKELNAFYQLMDFHPLSGAAIALWNTMMHFNNQNGWQQSFSAPDSIIEITSGIKGASFQCARNELREQGYIHVTTCESNETATYQMISLIKPLHRINSLSVTEEGQHIPAYDEQPHTQHVANDEMAQSEPQATERAEQSANDAMVDLTPEVNAIHKMEDNVKDNMVHYTEDNTVHNNVNNNMKDNTAHFMEDNMNHNTDHKVNHNADHFADHNADPLVKQYINKNKTKIKQNINQ